MEEEERCIHCSYLFKPHEISLNHTNATKLEQGIIKVCETPSHDYIQMYGDPSGAGFKHVKKSLRKSLKKSLRKSLKKSLRKSLKKSLRKSKRRA